METFGNRINQLLQDNRSQLFFQGEMTQLTYISYEQLVESVNNGDHEEYTFQYPIGYGADHKVMHGEKKYTKQDLLDRASYLANTKLPIDNIYQLVTITETLLNDLIRIVLIEYPQKISNKRKINVEIVLESESLESIQLYIVDSILNELAYKSPTEYSESFNDIVGIILLEEPVFHKYVELKATRDIHIHNKGIANEIYELKAKTLARVKAGIHLPVSMVYFLESYEARIQLNEILERKLDKIWSSENFRNRKTSLQEQKQAKISQAINEEE